MKILVTGATGNVGRLVVDELLAAGATDIRALTVDPARAALPAGVEVVRGYLGRLDSMPAALDGVDRMYLAPLLDTVRDVTRLARAAGVRRIVDLAGGEDTDWYAVEQAVEDCGVAWTHLEAGEFMANALMWAPQIKAGDVVRDAYPESANAPIALEDIAAVAARALLDDSHEGATHVLTGPETLTRRDQVRRLGAALGRDLRYVELTREEAIAELIPTMGEYAAWYVDGMAMLVEHPQRAVQTVREITGRPGTTFAQWAARNADSFR
jgi:uncharacterized protein YbjT (DUF2867 family)